MDSPLAVKFTLIEKVPESLQAPRKETAAMQFTGSF